MNYPKPPPWITEPPRQGKPEITGWRDLHLSQRRRSWGYNIPSCDIDMSIANEYNHGRSEGLIEYKRENAEPYVGSMNCQAMLDLAARATLPFFVVRYARDFSWYEPNPLNPLARRFINGATRMVERDFVEMLYHIHKQTMPEGLRFWPDV